MVFVRHDPRLFDLGTRGWEALAFLCLEEGAKPHPRFWVSCQANVQQRVAKQKLDVLPGDKPRTCIDTWLRIAKPLYSPNLLTSSYTVLAYMGGCENPLTPAHADLTACRLWIFLQSDHNLVVGCEYSCSFSSQPHTVILQIFGALKFRWRTIMEHSVSFKIRCQRILSLSLNVFFAFRCLFIFGKTSDHRKYRK